MSTTSIPDNGWYANVPLELHGHRKKLDFFIHSLEAYGGRLGLGHGDISVMEVGCSNGRNISLPLAEKGFAVTGVDIHEPSIRWANEHSPFDNARFVTADFNDFQNRELFDAVILSDILEHVDNPLEIVQIALQNLKPGGMALVCIPNGYGPYENENRLLRITRLDRLVAWLKSSIKRLLGLGKVAYNYESGHVQFYRIKDFQALADESGLEICEQANGALFGGGATYVLGMILPFIVRPSWRLADHLPASWVTTWYFRLERKTDSKKVN